MKPFPTTMVPETRIRMVDYASGVLIVCGAPVKLDQELEKTGEFTVEYLACNLWELRVAALQTAESSGSNSVWKTTGGVKFTIRNGGPGNSEVFPAVPELHITPVI